MSDAPRPPHHAADGTYRIPWPMEEGDRSRGFGSLLRWQLERLRQRLPPDPAPDALPRATPDLPARTPPGEVRVTWVGHASFVVQVGGLNLLTDPVWSRRASPSQRFGPARFTPPGVDLDALPEIDAVLLSHDHYDHLDEPTVRRLRDRFGAGLRWITPLSYAKWMAARGVPSVTELDWWETAEIGAGERRATVTCAPAQHWTRRAVTEFNDRLWGSFAVTAADGRRVYFGGDSGFWEGYPEIGRRLGPFDVTLMPIGAYEPRWFMKPAHMNPEEAVRAHAEMGGRGVFVPMHWGTFRLTDEDPLEPPVRLRAAWAAAGLPADALRVLRHGETAVVPPG